MNINILYEVAHYMCDSDSIISQFVSCVEFEQEVAKHIGRRDVPKRNNP